MTGEEFKALRRLNRNPVNRLCRRLLARLNAPGDPNALYSLQLARWGLENRDVQASWARYRAEVAEQALVMEAWPPEAAQKFLLDNPQDSLADGLAVLLPLLRGKAPKKAAVLLANNLGDNLQSILPGWRVPKLWG